MRFSIILLSFVISCSAAAQGVWSPLAHGVSIKYITEDRGPLRYATPIDIPLPKYDFELVRANLQGTVDIKFTIDADGAVRDIVIAQSTLNEFAAAVKDSVSKWKFKPVKKEPSQSGIIECRFVFATFEE